MRRLLSTLAMFAQFVATHAETTYPAPDLEHAPILNLSAPGCGAALRRVQLPALPDQHGVAGAVGGITNGVLIAGGGANFPNGAPWEGGTKVWYDTMWALPSGAREWTTVSRLAQPTAYGVSISTPDGVLCIGGDNAQQVFGSVRLLNYEHGQITTQSCPELPHPLTWAAGALLGKSVYVCGGIDHFGATTATRTFLSLDLSNIARGWQAVEPWPGPARIFPVTATHAGKLYLCSGAQLFTGADGKPSRTYLKDAYCYEPNHGWQKISDMPRAAVAAPSPCPDTEAGFRILGGDDGALAAKKPWPGHPGFVKSMLCYDAKADTWAENECAPFAVSAPLVPLGGAYALISGEIRPGVRTPRVEVLR